MVDELTTLEMKHTSDEGAPRVMVYQRPLTSSPRMISLCSDLSYLCTAERVHSSAASVSFLKGLMSGISPGQEAKELTAAHA